MTSIRFDFPEPFGPMRIFSGRSSISFVFGPKESRLTGQMDFKNGCWAMAAPSPFLEMTVRYHFISVGKGAANKERQPKVFRLRNASH
jgi:hypothetical protein